MRVEVIQYERFENHFSLVAFQCIFRNLVAERNLDRGALVVFRCPSVVHAFQSGFGRYVQQLAFHGMCPFALKSGGEDAADVAVALSLSFDGEGTFQRAFFIEGVLCLDTYVMVFRVGDRSQAQVGAFRCARQVILLLFGTAPQFPAERYPRGVERHHCAVTEFHYGHAVVEMVGRNGLHPAACHGHGRKGFESCHPQERNQCAGNVLAHPAAVGIIHLQVVQGESFSLSHGDTCITDVVGHPVGEYRHFFQFGFFTPNEFVYFLLGFRNGGETAVVFVDSVEPA